MMKKAIFAGFLLLAATGRAHAQQVDSCLCIWGAADSSVWLNPDTVMVDTCRYHGGVPINPPDEYVYSKIYEIIFEYAVIKLDSVSADSVLIVPWTYVDTSYSAFRTVCSNVAEQYDGLWFIKIHPEIGDSNENTYDEFAVLIGNYACVDTIRETLGGSQFSQIYYNRPIPVMYGVKTTSAPKQDNLIYSDADHVFLSSVDNRTPFTIFDFSGRMVRSSETDPNGSINLSSLAKGFYVLRTYGSVNLSFKILR